VTLNLTAVTAPELLSANRTASRDLISATGPGVQGGLYGARSSGPAGTCADPTGNSGARFTGPVVAHLFAFVLATVLWLSTRLPACPLSLPAGPVLCSLSAVAAEGYFVVARGTGAGVAWLLTRMVSTSQRLPTRF